MKKTKTHMTTRGVAIDDRTYKAVTKYAAERGVSVSSVVRALINEKLSEKPETNGGYPKGFVRL